MPKHEPMIVKVDGGSIVVRTIDDAKHLSKEVGQHWFDRDTMRFFNTRIHTKGRLIGLRYFITSERMDASIPWRYSIHEVLPNGRIDTIGDGGPTKNGFRQYATLKAARDKAKQLAKMGEGIPSNPIKAGYGIPTVQANIRKLIREGRDQKAAVAIALQSARLSYRKAHPRGPFPERLKKASAPCNQAAVKAKKRAKKKAKRKSKHS